VARLRHIGIVGAGLAGLATAVAAAAAGVRVEACVRRGFAYGGVSVVDADGKAHFEIATPALGGARLPAAIGMPYAELMRVLHDAALARGAAVHWRCAVREVEPHGAQPRVALADGRRLGFDLVVLAGAADVAGIELPLPAGAERLPQRWDYVLLPRPPGIDRLTWVVGPGPSKALILPVSVRQAGLALLRDERVPGVPAASTPAQLRAALAAGGTLLGRVGALLRDDATVVARPVRSGLLSGDWHVGAALRVGSSAHVLPPHFGQAAAQAIEDACVLADLLDGTLERSELLDAFHRSRAARVRQVHDITTTAARWDLQPWGGADMSLLMERLARTVAQPARET
jgi:2-polyprenyl-6-methoxyphenol hydroxylase-like FAD-dependent oxidoreductase